MALTGSERRSETERGDWIVAPFDLLTGEASLALLRLLGFLGCLLFLRHWSNPPLQVGLMREGDAAPPQSRLPPGTQPACAGSFSLRRALAGAARYSCPLAVGSGQKEKVGQCSKRDRPISERPSLTSSLPSWPSWPPSSLSSPLVLLKGFSSCLMAATDMA
jgi:hypothetical protein